MTPGRVQLRRTKGWRLPPGAVSVARPTRWGNPFVVGAEGLQWAGGVNGEVLHYGERTCWVDHEIHGVGLTPRLAVELYRIALVAITTDSAHDGAEDRDWSAANRALVASLRGHDLACWCPLADPCHADVLLELANQ